MKLLLRLSTFFSQEIMLMESVIFPGQEDVLELKSMKEQYALLASYLRQVPKHITMFMCRGNTMR
jgi:hypothetical protein